MEVEVLRRLVVEVEDLRGLEGLGVEAVGFESEEGDMPWGRVGFAVDPWWKFRLRRVVGIKRFVSEQLSDRNEVLRECQSESESMRLRIEGEKAQEGKKDARLISKVGKWERKTSQKESRDRG